MERNIKYLNRDFNSFREQLIEFAKNYFPDTYTDFSETSPGMMFIEMAAYVGEVLGFYQDNQVQETFLQYVKNPSNLYNIAYMMGYKPKVTTVSEVELEVTDTVDAKFVLGNYEPDWTQAYRISEFSEVKSNTSGDTSFLLRDPVDFNQSSSMDRTLVEVGSIDEDGNPVSFILTKKAKAFSGKIKTVKRTVGEYQKYRTLTIVDKNIVGVLDIKDSDGNEWVEVPCLGQDTVFEDVSDTGSIENTFPHTLKLKKVSRRFVTRFTSKGELNIQFGAGMYASDEDEKNFLPNPVSLASGVQELSKDRYDLAYDPSNFLFSKSYGLSPTNTELTIRYIVGGGVKSNVPANTITQFGEVYISSKTGQAVDVERISFNNPKAASGGRDGDTVEEIRQNCLRSFAEQKRVVTLNDYNVRSLSMPSEYGSVTKVYAVNESLLDVGRSSLNKNPLAITLYVLGYDLDGKLTYCTSLVKENLKTYLSQYLMLTEAVDIKDAFIVNLGIKYDIVLCPGYMSRDVLLRCNNLLQDYFKIDNISINEPINISKIYSLLDSVEGVQTVKNIVIENKVGEGKYSEYAYDVLAATKDNVLYPSYDPCIFEVRYPNVDIEGRIVTL